MNKVDIEDIYPLSPLQQGMLFHTLYAPSSGVYLAQMHCVLRGDLNIPILEQAWQQTITQNPIFRTSFVWKRLDEPLQVVHKQAALKIRQRDWRGLSADAQTQKLDAYLKHDRDQGLNLTYPPLMRLALIHISEDTYRFIWTYSDLLLDGWSLALVLETVFINYQLLCQGKSIYSEPSRPYGEYIEWLSSQDMSKAESFWRDALQGFTAPTSLGVDRPVKSLSDAVTVYDENQVYLSTTTTSALQSYARQYKLTLNTLLQGAWALLLNRYSGEEDILYGNVVSGRPTTLNDVETMIGTFINTIPMRTQVRPQDTVVGWLKSFQQKQIDLRQYQHTPLMEIQRWSELPHSTPLFDSVVIVENHPVSASLREQPDRLSIEDVQFIERTSYPLTLVIVPGWQLLLKVMYDCAHFTDTAIDRLLGHYQKLLEGIIEHPEKLLSQLTLLTAAEHHQIVVEWNKTQKEYPQRGFIHQLFEAQAASQPEEIAAIFEDEQITYHQLNQAANRLAHILAAEGVGPEVIVALLGDRTIDYLIAILAVLKAGGAFLPLSPHYPQQQKTTILKRSEPLLLLTTNDFVDDCAQVVNDISPAKRPKICLLTEMLPKSGEDNNLPLRCDWHHQAYIMFTSGSTGIPKGVMVDHIGMLNHIYAKITDLGMSHEDILAQNGPQSFDIMVWQFLAPLIIGGQVHIFSDEIVRDTVALFEAVERAGVTVLQLVPAQLQTAVHTLAAKTENDRLRLPKLRWIVPTGDALPTELCRQWLQLYPHIPMLNTYGTTECSDDTCHYQIYEPPAVDYPLPIMTIGTAIMNMEAYILDAFLQPVPVGVVGDIYTGGIGVGRGYLKDVRKTAVSFIPDLFSSKPGTRLYRTGDQGRYLPDGTIEFLGRLDHQVKIRGFRIELGAIEDALNRHPAIQETIIVAKDHPSGDKHLVAYITITSGQAYTTTELKHFLQEQLPDYMIPGIFVEIPSLPVTANGKLDRKALPPPPWRQYDVQKTFVAPQTPIETVIAGIWQETLGVEQIGIHHDFFELGGHSLIATRIIAQINNIFGSELPIRALFENATVTDLSAYLLRVPETRKAALESIAETMLQLAQMSDSEVEQMLNEASSPSQEKAI